MKRFTRLLICIVFAIAGCGGKNASPSGTAASAVLASTTILADIAQNIAGDRLHIGSILPVGADPHSYQPTPQDVVKVADARLIIMNDPKYETFMEPLLQNAGGQAELVYAATGVGKIVDSHNGGFDPHVWLDPKNVILVVENIREGFTYLDPEGAAVYRSNADAYAAELESLDAWIVEQVNQIPVEKRMLVTNHEAFGYFSERYGFTVVGSVLESFSTDASPSAQQMAGLIDQIKSSGAHAIFLDASDNSALAEQIAAETGAQVVTDLHLESLTDDQPAATYVNMMKHNVTLIVEALK